MVPPDQQTVATAPHPVRTETTSGHHRLPVRMVAWLAAATLGVLANSSVYLFSVTVAPRATTPDPSTVAPQVAIAVALVAGLAVLRLRPAVGWAWLLLAGTVLALPLPLSVMSHELFDGVPADLTASVVATAAPLVLVGLLGAAAWLRANDADGEGASLAGSALVMQMVGALVLTASLLGGADIRLLFPVLEGVALVAAVTMVAVLPALTRHARPAPAPGTRTIALGAAATLIPVAAVIASPSSAGSLENYLPVFGVCTAVAGLAVAAALGWRALAGAVATALIALTLFVVVTIVVAGLRANGTVVIIAALLGIGAGWVACRTAARLWLAAAGLAAAAVIMFILLLGPGGGMFSAPSTGPGAVLLLVGVAAAVAAAGSMAALLAPRLVSATALGPVAAALQFSGVLLLSWLQLDARDTTSGRAVAEQLVVAGGVLLLVAAGLVALLARFGGEVAAQPELAAQHHDGVVGTQQRARHRG